MGEVTGITWTDHTFNAWQGCTKVSPGCTNCYAKDWDDRFGGGHWGPGRPRKIMSDHYWAQPLKWNREAQAEGKCHKVFCASMADVFDIEAPADQRERLWALIRVTPFLDWQILTKRPEKIAEYLPADWGDGYPNVWLGTSVEDQKAANKRIPELLKIPATLRFLSCEPLLGFVKPCDVTEWEDTAYWWGKQIIGPRGIGWIIAGGESGPNAREMHPDWARSLRDLCKDNIPFYFKQWGSHVPVMEAMNAEKGGMVSGVSVVFPDGRVVVPDASKQWWEKLEEVFGSDGAAMLRVNKTTAGHLLDGVEHFEFPSLG